MLNLTKMLLLLAPKVAYMERSFFMTPWSTTVSFVPENKYIC